MARVSVRAEVDAAQGPLAIQRAAAIGRGMVAAIEELHAAGCAHGGLDAELVSAGEDGAVRVEVAAAGGERAATCAPEIQRGGEASPAGDVYAAGCVLYEMLAGRPPFRGAAAAVAAQHMHAVPAKPSTHNAEIPADLDRLVIAMLAKNADERPNTRAVCEELEKIVAVYFGATIKPAPSAEPRVPPPAPVEKEVEKPPARTLSVVPVRRRNRARWMVAALAALAVAGVIAVRSRSGPERVAFVGVVAPEGAASSTIAWALASRAAAEASGVETPSLDGLTAARVTVLGSEALAHESSDCLRGFMRALRASRVVAISASPSPRGYEITVRVFDRELGAPVLRATFAELDDAGAKILNALSIARVPSRSIAIEALASEASFACAIGRYDLCSAKLEHANDPSLRALAHRPSGEVPLEDLERARERARKDADPWPLIDAAGAIFRSTHDRDRAIALYREARAIAPYSYAAIRGEAEMLGARGEDRDGRRRASTFLWTAITCAPTSPVAALLGHDAVLWDLGRPAEGITCGDH